MEPIDLDLVQTLASGYVAEQSEDPLSLHRARSMIAHTLQGITSPEEKKRFANYLKAGRGGDLGALIDRIQNFTPKETAGDK